MSEYGIFPCPCCAQAAVMIERRHDGGPQTMRIACTGCGLMTPAQMFTTDEERPELALEYPYLKREPVREKLVHLWNKRGGHEVEPLRSASQGAVLH